MRAALVLAFLVAGVNASAQGTKVPAKPDSAKAPAAKAPVTKTPPPAVTKQGATPPPAAATKQGTKAPAATDTKAAARPPAQSVPVQVAPVIMRETFVYAQESRRDPFVSLLTSNELRPTVADLRITGILYDESGQNSIATMRDLGTNELYRVKTGQVLGRMRVALIKRGAVIFSIEEFGLNRQDSLVLGDTTKARVK